jgi:chromosome segregation ATPase
MSIINSILKAFVGDKSEKDVKAIQPLDSKVKSFESALQTLSHDELRAKTSEFKSKIQQARADKDAKIIALKQEAEQTQDIDAREDFYTEIDAIEKELRSLSKDQKDLKNETLKNDTPKDKLEDKQQKINDQFEQLKEDLKEMEKLNDELSDKMDIKTPEDLKNETDQNLQEAKELLEKNKFNKKLYISLIISTILH